MALAVFGFRHDNINSTIQPNTFSTKIVKLIMLSQIVNVDPTNRKTTQLMLLRFILKHRPSVKKPKLVAEKSGGKNIWIVPPPPLQSSMNIFLSRTRLR